MKNASLSVVLNVFFNMKYWFYDNYFMLIKSWLIRTLHSQGHRLKTYSPLPSPKAPFYISPSPGH